MANLPLCHLQCANSSAETNMDPVAILFALFCVSAVALLAGMCLCMHLNLYLRPPRLCLSEVATVKRCQSYSPIGVASA